MTTYISILRGINVGGNRLIKMSALIKMYENLNLEDVKTYIQSGNVIFSTTEADFKKLEDLISSQIEKEFGFSVPVIVMTKEKLQNIIESNPFSNDPKKDTSFLHVTFLGVGAKENNKEIMDSKIQVGEEIFVTEDVVYLYFPHGYAKTKLNNNFLESKLKVKATTRNWKTTQELLNLATKIDFT